VCVAREGAGRRMLSEILRWSVQGSTQKEYRAGEDQLSYLSSLPHRTSWRPALSTDLKIQKVKPYQMEKGILESGPDSSGSEK